MFLVDKYSPKTEDDITFNKDILQKLKTISDDDAVPHTIFYGPEGSGKKTLIYMFLEMIYDSSVYDLNDVTYTVSGSGNNETQVKVKQSNYHIVIEPNNNNSDRYLIQGVLKEYVKRVPLNIFKTKTHFKTVLINNVDNLSYYTQTALRRMMEMYSDTCRFILWCRTLNKVIDPIISRCLNIRVSSPCDEDILQRAIHIGCLEGLDMTLEDYNSIVKECQGNFKICAWLMDLKRHGYDDTNVYSTEISAITDLILECRLDNIVKIRDMLYKIIITNIDEIRILKDILDSLIDSDKITDDAKFNIIDIASEIEFNLKRGRREIVHLEAFVQKVLYEIRLRRKEDIKNNSNTHIKKYKKSTTIKVDV